MADAKKTPKTVFFFEFGTMPPSPGICEWRISALQAVKTKWTQMGLKNGAAAA